MAEEEDDASIHTRPLPQSPSPSPSRPPPFVEVTCTNSGKVRRFAAGTEAKFAVSVMNRKLEIGNPLALHIQAVKQGEEPVIFGPNALLVDYGNGWKLVTVTAIEVEGRRKGEASHSTRMHDSSETDLNGSHPVKKESAPSFHYFGRIFLALFLIFFLGAIFTLALENLPRLILFINSSM